MNKTEILCIGNPMVDIFINLDRALADKYGITEPAQHIDREIADALFNEKSINFEKAAMCSGGGSANVAKIASMLGIKTAFTGCAGNDERAAFFKEELSKVGVEVILALANDQTGVCFTCNVDGATRFAACPGAALEFKEENISEDLIAAAELIAVDGYLLERRPLVQHILIRAARRGIPVALDAASVFQVKSKAEDILTYSRQFPLIVFMNADEAIAFYNTVRKSKEEVLNLTEKEKEVIVLRDICPMLKLITEGEIFPIVVVKLGGRGAVVVAGGNFYHVETFTIIPRNTVGAGDTFCAAFLAAWIRDKSLTDCAALGNKVAREILDVKGTDINSGKLKSFAKMLQK